MAMITADHTVGSTKSAKTPSMHRLLALATILLGFYTGQAPAQMADDAIACYGRAYSADHMAANPGQSIVEMQIIMDAGFSGEPSDHQGPSMVETTVRAMTRDRFGEFFVNTGVCPWIADQALYECQIECDGGIFRVVLADDGTASLTNTDWGFTLYGGCTVEVEAGREIEIPADEDHAAFLLYPMPIETCPIGIWTLYDSAID